MRRAEDRRLLKVAGFQPDPTGWVCPILDTVVAFEVLDHVSVVAGTADFRDPEELDQFVLCHDGGIGAETSYLMEVEP